MKSLAQPAHPNTRETRALALYCTSGHEICHAEEDLYLVPSCSGSGTYTVRYGGAVETCSCLDYEIRGENCKHILAVAIAHAKRRRPCALCYGSGVHVLEVEDHDGEIVEETVPCRRCRRS